MKDKNLNCFIGQNYLICAFIILCLLFLVMSCDNDAFEEKETNSLIESIEDNNENCMDELDYIDAQGYSCWEWEGYDCEKAVEDWGYTEKEEKDIINNCPKSCDLCDEIDTYIE